ncbi:hypothetical protein P9E03_20765 [Bacillus mojavensis]|uniref:hypothetical protein n=1 Tax=Bacillus subtilis group TaxID=653685 RepID=UPI00228223DD|nr:MULTISPECIES: hypothetical protein [Bacillus subtilis group]MCY8106655.1 hypothetical protein [Bacillus mojavensis]MCY8480129.1 hypothetical protein [Bacillus mojavensis]MCY9093269.1 hypothetical protein [Bacillus mojavensis]MEC1528538.1 hypothetical protein [Bacillus spizizenii]MEC1801444.1 hypothetical protein [Bacillus mojavensis]
MFLKGSGAAFYLMVLSPLNEFIEYLDDVEDRFENVKMRYENEAKELSPEIEEDYWDYYIDEYHDFNITYPSILRSSVFTSIYSFLEYHLISRCLDKDILEKVKYDRGIFKAKNYFKLIYKSNEKFNQSKIFSNSIWNKIIDYSKIRNCYVHNSGIITMIPDEEKQKEIIQIIRKTNHIEIDDRKRIQILDRGFCKEFHEVVYKFICDLNNLLIDLKD